jgi:hypothetical protein
VQLRAQIAGILGVAVVAAAVAVVITGGSFDTAGLQRFGLVVAVVTIACVAFDKWIWAWPMWKGWLVSRPHIRGTWQARLISNYMQDGKPVEKIVYVVIRQSFSFLSIRMYTDAAKSFSLAHNLSKADDDDVFRASIVYLNEPQLKHRGKSSEIHYGALLIADIVHPVTVMKGHYWTDRGTSGVLELLRRNDQVAGDFEQAARLFTT